jgi:hypothetical protein
MLVENFRSDVIRLKYPWFVVSLRLARTALPFPGPGISIHFSILGEAITAGTTAICVIALIPICVVVTALVTRYCYFFLRGYFSKQYDRAQLGTIIFSETSRSAAGKLNLLGDWEP